MSDFEKYRAQKQRYAHAIGRMADEAAMVVEGHLEDSGFTAELHEVAEQSKDDIAIWAGRQRAELRGDYDKEVLDRIEAELRMRSKARRCRIS